jgi:cysteine desulfurase
MRIYLDYASLTPIDKRVFKEIKKYYNMDYTNPSSLYLSGVKAQNALENAKRRVAKVLHAHSDEIVFTSGGTESNELVLKNHNNIVISAIEHSSIIKDSRATHIPVDLNGVINLEKLKNAITPETTLVSIMFVNNETGIIEPIEEVAKIIRDFRKKNNSMYPLIHTDASQALYLPMYVEKLGVDLLTLDGNKIYGPRGIGALYVKRGTPKIEREGTANIPAIMGFAKALEIMEEKREKEVKRIGELKKYFFDELKKINLNIKVNGDLENSSVHILNIEIPGIDSEFFVLQLDAKGIECSTKSACLRDEDESYVLKEMKANSKNSIRFSFGRKTSKRDIKKTVKIIEKILLKRD